MQILSSVKTMINKLLHHFHTHKPVRNWGSSSWLCLMSVRKHGGTIRLQSMSLHLSLLPFLADQPSLLSLFPVSLTRTICEQWSQVFHKPLISGEISCNLSYTVFPLIWLILQASDKREGIPVGCCNAVLFQRWLFLTPFNLFLRGGRYCFSAWQPHSTCLWCLLLW